MHLVKFCWSLSSNPYQLACKFSRSSSSKHTSFARCHWLPRNIRSNGERHYKPITKKRSEFWGSIRRNCMISRPFKPLKRHVFIWLGKRVIWRKRQKAKGWASFAMQYTKWEVDLAPYDRYICLIWLTRDFDNITLIQCKYTSYLFCERNGKDWAHS